MPYPSPYEMRELRRVKLLLALDVAVLVVLLVALAYLLGAVAWT